MQPHEVERTLAALHAEAAAVRGNPRYSDEVRDDRLEQINTQIVLLGGASIVSHRRAAVSEQASARRTTSAKAKRRAKR